LELVFGTSEISTWPSVTLWHVNRPKALVVSIADALSSIANPQKVEKWTKNGIKIAL
jgi:hypothetical protein